VSILDCQYADEQVALATGKAVRHLGSKDTQTLRRKITVCSHKSSL